MKRIFTEKVSKISAIKETSPNISDFKVKIEYNLKLEPADRKEEIITELSIDAYDNGFMTIMNTKTSESNLVEINNIDDLKALKIIINAAQIKDLKFNFNPYVKGKGNMIFLDAECFENKITGIGLDNENRYVLQKIDTNAEKYNNELFYSII